MRTPVKRHAARGSALLAAGGAGAALAFLLDPDNGRRRRHVLRDRTLAAGRGGVRRTIRRADYAAGHLHGAAHRLAPARRKDAPDDVTLAHEVEGAIARAHREAKGAINVNACDGVVELRGQLTDGDEIVAVARTVERVDGVARVENLLHIPGEPPRHAPPPSPGELRDRLAAGAREDGG